MMVILGESAEIAIINVVELFIYFYFLFGESGDWFRDPVATVWKRGIATADFR